MRNIRGTRHSLANTRTLTVIAQDPAVKFRGQVLTTELTVPAEELLAGPCGYRVNVIDYDASTDTLYKPMIYGRSLDGKYEDPFAFKQSGRSSVKARRLHHQRRLEDPRFHAQNVYAIVMRTLAQFEFALGRRCAWGFDGHQIHIVPHAFADANAFYSRDDRAIFLDISWEVMGSLSSPASRMTSWHTKRPTPCLMACVNDTWSALRLTRLLSTKASQMSWQCSRCSRCLTW
jgi:hypothetical protein